MKALFRSPSAALLLLALSLSTTALATDYTEVPAEKVSSYKEAVRLAFARSKLNCLDSRFSDGLQFAQTVKLDSRGEQPILVFEHKRDNGTLKVTRIYSTEDYEWVRAVRIEWFVWANTNQGTLRDPKIAPGWLADGSALCGQLY